LNSRYFRPVRRKETRARRWDLQFESTFLRRRVICELEWVWSERPERMMEGELRGHVSYLRNPGSGTPGFFFFFEEIRMFESPKRGDQSLLTRPPSGRS